MFSDDVFGNLTTADLGSQFEKPEDPDKQLKAYLATLPLNQRREYVANMRGTSRPAAKQEAAPRGIDMNDQGFGFALGGMNMGSAMANQHFGHMARMYGDINDAMSDEMARRSAIAREQRRLGMQQYANDQRMALELLKLERERERDKMDAELMIRKLRAELQARNPNAPVVQTIRSDGMGGLFYDSGAV